MSVPKEEELPPPGHVMAIIDAMNKSDFLKARTSRTSLPPESLSLGVQTESLSFGLDSSLPHSQTRTSVSLNSSSVDLSSSSLGGECGPSDSIELEALYSSGFQATCQSNALNQFGEAKYVCVCSKKKCTFGSNHKQLSKSLSDFESSSACDAASTTKQSFRKYFTTKRDKRSSNKVSKTMSTLPLNDIKKWPSVKKSPMETFEIIDICDSAIKPNPPKKSKFSSIRRLKRDTIPQPQSQHPQQQLSIPVENINGLTTIPVAENMNGDILDANGGVDVPPTTPAKSCSDKSKQCCQKCFSFRKLTIPRIVLLIFGILIFLTGVSYDIGLKHAVDALFLSCWNTLKHEYQTFGENFIKYQTYVFQNKGNPNTNAEDVFDETFLSTLENTEFSLQMHFFNIKDEIVYPNSIVKVEDVGPLYFKIYFKRSKGLEMKYIRNKSNLTLSSAFEVYDIMKAMLLSNQLPYFGFHIKDHYKTTPKALLKVFIDSLSKFQVDTSFFSTLQSQILASVTEQRSKRSLDEIRLRECMESLMNEIFLPLPVNKNKIVDLPLPSLERNLTLTYKNLEYLSGLEGYRYIIKDITPSITQKWSKNNDRPYSTNELYKSDKKSYKDNIFMDLYSAYSKRDQGYMFNNFSMPGNVLNLNPILLSLFGRVFFLGKYLEVYPFWISSPHFISDYQNPESNSIFRRNAIHSVDGFQPEENRHGSYLYYHPLLGVPINGSITMQIGIYPPDGMLYAQKLVPIMWIRLQLDKIHPLLWMSFWLAFSIRVIIILFLVFFSFGIITCVLKCSCGKKCDEQMV